ncbi:Alpha/Beta hydrolase protein [Aspergillus aurantiobrunneus]
MDPTVKAKLNRQFPDTVYTPLVHPDKHPHYNYTGFHPGEVKILQKGHVKEPGFQAFPTAVIWQRDNAIPMRDGVALYGDIFRPAADDKVPAIIAWSPYGKAGNGAQTYDVMGPYRMGIPYQSLSGYETFEGPNPAEWCSRGYAIVDIDARGAGHSEGDIMFWGEQEAWDIHDSISWICKQPWCNGSVVMMGNSWLAISQINFASRLRHPNLKAIAPWEAFTNVYAQQACRGGIPSNSGFLDLIIRGFAGFNKAEDIGAMTRRHSFFDDYWKEKMVQPENIDIPMYLTASYSTGLHCEGSFQTFEQARTSQKWLRVHASQEWHDLYTPGAIDDLQRFYDFYAKGIQNGWETGTPKVRLSLLGYDGSFAKSVIERPETQWPPARHHREKLYLEAATRSLVLSKPGDASVTAHEGHSLTDSSDFTLKFTKYTELCGRPFTKLYMSCSEGTDFDVVVQIRKISCDGKQLASLNWSPMPKPEPQVLDVNVAKHLGQQGMLRASHRVSLHPRNSEDEIPVYSHEKGEPVEPGQIVPLIIPIWPVGIVFEAGEGLMLKVSGHDMSLPEVEIMRPTAPVDVNKGRHTVHTGGEYGSYIVLPVISE